MFTDTRKKFEPVAMVPGSMGGTGFLHFLVDTGAIDSLAAQRVARAVAGSGQPVSTILLELGLLEEGKLADALAAFLGLARVTPADFPEVLPTADDIPHDLLRRANILPLELTDQSVAFAVARPLDDTTARSVGYFLNLEPILKVGVESEIARHLAELLVSDVVETGTVDASVQPHDPAGGDVERLRDVASEAPIIRLLNRLVATGVERSASDIHIEPLDDHVRIRYRIDGALQVAEILDRSLQLGLISRVKILARLNIAEQRLPQDGRIRLAVRGRDIDFRVSTSPTHHGESVVLRILDRRDVALEFGALGFAAASCSKLQRLLACPNGIILVTGPTGSGKTTTLYAALNLLNQPRVKTFSVEDPIEYHLKGVNQVLVRPQIGLDFATVLRSILRQDPDIIMIGEIRDSETARIAVQASLTGHLVLSTLHTNSAASSVTRLRNIGVDNFLIVSSLRAVVAQRLVRKLCLHCKQQSGGRCEPVGCKHCHDTGYSGRTVIYEILEIDDEIKQAILGEQSEATIEAIAGRAGMASLQEVGLLKVASGETSLEEVTRNVMVPET